MSTRFRRCTVFGCKKSNKEVKLFSIPEGCSEKWLEVIKFRKPIQWVPTKTTKICALHFKKSDIVCNKITAGAHPFLKVPSDHIDSDHNYSVPPYSLLVEKVKKMQESVLNLESRLKNERKRKWRQKNTAETLQEALTEAKLNITDASLENLMHRANDITGELISTVKRVFLKFSKLEPFPP